MWLWMHLHYAKINMLSLGGSVHLQQRFLLDEGSLTKPKEFNRDSKIEWMTIC